MNSRSGVNQSSLVNFSTDLPSLDAKDSLLSFPFDHLYACHSDSTDQRDALQATKEVDLPTQCVIGEDKNLGASGNTEVDQLNDRLTASENQNKRLKDLLIYHLDLIQQQNELITKRDKLYQALRQENENLKTKLNRRHGLILPPPPPPPPPVILPPPPPPPLPLPAPPPPPVTSAVGKSDASEVMLDSFSELMLPENRSNSYLFDSDLNKTKNFEKETFGIARTTTTSEPDGKSYTATDAAAPSIVETTKPKYSSMRCEGFKPIDSKRSLIKKDALKTEPRSEALYTITSNSGNPVIQRVQRNRKRSSTGVGHLSRIPKTTPKVETPEPSKQLDEPTFDHFGINKKNKFINTYGKTKTATTSTATSTTTTMPKRMDRFGSLSERLQLIDTTPTGEDPYQLGEADLREQSPIPKLMLQKTNHGRMKVMDQPTRRIYDPDSPEPKTSKARSNRFLSSTFTDDLKKEAKTMLIQDPDLDLVKTEPEIDWRLYSPKFKTAIETCTSSTPPLPISEFSFGDPNSLNALNINLDCSEFQDLFSDSSLNLEELNVGNNFNATDKTAEESSEQQTAEVPQQIEQPESFMSPLLDSVNEQASQLPPVPQVDQEPQDDKDEQDEQDEQDDQDDHDNPLEFAPIEPIMPSTSKDSKRGRKRAHSTTGLGKGGKGGKPPAKPRPRGRAAARGKKTPPPAKTTTTEYHTHNGDIDLSWYYGLDADIKLDDLELDALDDPTSATVELDDIIATLEEFVAGELLCNQSMPINEDTTAAGIVPSLSIQNLEERNFELDILFATIEEIAAADKLDSKAREEDGVNKTSETTVHTVPEVYIQYLEDTSVQVPRWREMPYTTLYTLEGTELVEDRVFEKRHQKLEAEERRQLRWHMRRIREQRHVEKLRQRQRDSWCTTVTVPSVYTVWPRPQRDIRFIEITDTLPVMAFGEALPDIQEADFMLPWVRTSKALKRSKRSKTLH